MFLMMLKLIAPVLALLQAVDGEECVCCPINADLSDPNVQDALAFAVVQYNNASVDTNVSVVVKVIKAQSQVICGMNYIFEVEMATSLCRKGSVEDKCCVVPIEPDAPVKACNFSVPSKPWMNFTELNYTCTTNNGCNTHKPYNLWFVFVLSFCMSVLPHKFRVM